MINKNMLNGIMNHMLKSGKLPQNAKNFVHQVMSNAKENADPAAVMNMMEQMGQQQGWDLSKLQNTPHYQELKNKGKDEVIPYALSSVKQMGFLGTIFNLFGGKK